LSPAHVEALNSIDLEFSQKKKDEKLVVERWQEYLDHLDPLGNRQMDAAAAAAWNIRRVDLLVELLYEMGSVLGYDFSKTQIKNGTYAPNAHGQVEDEQSRIRTLVLDLLDGKRDLPMRVTNLRTSANPDA
jgi:hypothetical protein